jgi:hypothetical protein
MTSHAICRSVLALLCAAAAAPVLPGAAAATPPGFTLSPAQYWASEWATAPRLPTAGDADGDGHADLLSLWPEGDGVIDVARTSPFGKTVGSVPGLRGFGRDGVAGACGRFTGGVGVDYVGVFADGSVLVASRMARGTAQYTVNVPAGTIPKEQMPKRPVHAIPGDFDGGGGLDVLLAGADGRLLLLRNETAPGAGSAAAAPRFVAVSVAGRLPDGARELAAGAVGDDGRARLFFMDNKGAVARAVLQKNTSAAAPLRLGTPFPVCRAAPGEKMAVGRFLGGATADLLVGRRLLPGGDPARVVFLPNLPGPDESREDEHWIVADFDGNGKDDLLRRRASRVRFRERDVYIHYASDARDDPKGFISTAQDGLLDDWKTGKRTPPGGLDLRALGCKVGRRDVIVEIGRFENVDEGRLRAEMDIAVRKFAEMPLVNPDGSRGIALHVIFQAPMPLSQRDRVHARFDEEYPAPEHRGVTHYFLAEAGGPLVAQIMGANGHFDGSHTQFLHEFGHNLGLVHEGHWGGPPFCPIYPSVMNYTYNGSLYSVENVRYSDGRLGALGLDERRLSERLPLSAADAAYLGKSPYHFRLRPGAKPDETLVDWNWNGVFGEEDIAADINYKPGAHIGGLNTVTKAQTAPALVAHGEGADAALLLLYGTFGESAGGAAAGERNLSPRRPGGLRARRWAGKDVDADGGRWADPVTLEPSGVTGEASACHVGGTTWAAYPAADGVRVRPLWLENGAVRFGDATVVPGSTGASPTLAAVGGGRLALLLWRNGQTPVGLRLATPGGEHSAKFGRETQLDCWSGGPVGAAAAGGDGLLFVATVEERDTGHREWLRTHRYAVPSGTTAFSEGPLRASDRQWAGGRHAGQYSYNRPILLWERVPGFEAEGRLFALAGGRYSSAEPWSKHYVTMQVADKTIDVDWSLSGGWLTRQYHGGDVRSRSAPGACFFRGEIALAQRRLDGDARADDDVIVMFHARGVEAGAMGDFDDVGFIRDVGLRRSIFNVAP